MKTTPLHDSHEELGAKMVEFAGWHMPVQYGPILDEVKRVRSAAGLFDLSHMGRICVSGPDAVKLVDRVATNHCARIPIGSIRYSLFCREDGGVLDDLLLYRDDEDKVYMVVNAVNCDRDLEWLRQHAGGFDAEVQDLTAEQAMLAVQGPNALDVVTELTEDCELADLGYYKFTFGTVCRLARVRISRTGYTGENGYEVYCPASAAERVWTRLLEAGEKHGLAPIGLGARDVLRLEAGMALYGHELDEDHNPIEAGLGFAVSFREEKGDYIGREALQRIKGARKQRLVGVTTPGPRVPRQGHVLYKGDEQVGTICSGAPSPTLETNVATAFVAIGSDRPGEELDVDFRGKRQPVTVQELPFYSKTRK